MAKTTAAAKKKACGAPVRRCGTAARKTAKASATGKKK